MKYRHLAVMSSGGTLWVNVMRKEYRTCYHIKAEKQKRQMH